jgi:hypothetical protein
LKAQQEALLARQKILQKRTHIANELLQTEQSFVDGLKVLREVYITPVNELLLILFSL